MSIDKNRRIFLALLYSGLLGMGLWGQACSERTPTNTFDELADSTIVGDVKLLTLAAPDTAATDVVFFNTSTSPFLYLGSTDGKNMSIAMRFSSLPDLPNFTQARILLEKDVTFAMGSGGMINATVHEIKQDWALATLRFEDTQTDFFEPVPVGSFSFQITEVTDTTNTDRTVAVDIDTA